MRILFLCGSLKPGHDGVGDYTRRLAGELIRQGHACRMIALNDRYVEKGKGLDQVESQDGVPTLRLPAAASWSARIKAARLWSGEFKADWISLQFVPYSFHPRGLPFELGKRLKPIAPKGNWHVMFHELWIGMEQGSPARQQVAGFLQRVIIRRLVRNLDTKAIHTQSRFYQHQLSTLDLSAMLLPLFGNIPVFPTDPSFTPSPDSIQLIHFGVIRPSVPLESFVRELASVSKSVNRTPKFCLVGRSGLETDRWKHVFESAGIEFTVYGEQSACVISRLLHEADVGIITTPIALAEKSGAFAAMCEHGLPVMALTYPWATKGATIKPSSTMVRDYSRSNLKQLIGDARKYQTIPNALEVISRRFVSDLIRRDRGAQQTKTVKRALIRCRFFF